MSYYITQDGEHIAYSKIAALISEHHPELVGANIFAQVDALGVRDEFNDGDTPNPLPYSFSEYWGLWQVVVHAGFSNETLLSEWESFDDAYCAKKEQFTEGEAEELGVDILHNWSTEY